MRLKDKTAIITGGGTGIGLATARAFYQEGAKIILFGRRKEKLEKAVEKLGDSAIIVQGDMTNNNDLDQLINETLHNFKKIDILVNNAGLFNGSPLHEISDSQWDEIMDMTADLMKDAELMKEWSKDYPIGRFGKPEDVANACLYLASDESSFVTGITLPVDGGFTSH